MTDPLELHLAAALDRAGIAYTTDCGGGNHIVHVRNMVESSSNP